MTIIVLILSVSAISIITVLINSIYETVYDIHLKTLTHCSFVGKTGGDLFLNSSVTKKLQTNPDIDKLIPCDIDYTGINLAIGGNSSVPVVFSDQDNIRYYLDQIKANIKEGRLPDNAANEIAVHWRIMAGKNWKIGQLVGNEIDPKETLSGTYKIVGILNGDNVAIVGTKSFRQEQYIKNGLDLSQPVAYIVFPKTDKLSSVNSFIDALPKTEARSSTYSQFNQMIEDQLASLNGTTAAIIMITIIIISFSIGAFMYLIYLQRSDEFGILMAMGYRRGFIYRLIFKEVFSLDILSWFFGIIVAYLLVQLLNITSYNPKGLILNFLNIKVFVYTLAIPLSVALFSIYPIFMKVRRQDPITIIERRD